MIVSVLLEFKYLLALLVYRLRLIKCAHFY